MDKKIFTNRGLQGNLSIEKRQDLMFSHVQTYSQKRTLLGSHFVKMLMVGYYFRINPDNTIDWQNPISSGDLILDLKDLGLKGTTDSDIKRMISSDTIKDVSPLHLVYQQIESEKWDGTDYIQNFVDALNLKGNYTTNSMIIRKWIINTYTLAMKDIDKSISWNPIPRVVVILHSEKRKLGKSSILRWLGLEGLITKTIPNLMVDVYSELQSGMTKDERQFQIMLAGSMVLNFDDIGEMLMNSPAELRAICSKTGVQIRTLYTDKNKSLRRRAGICGSTNNSNVLRDGDENRYAVFSMKDHGVNWGVINSIDAINVWRQAKYEAEQLGFDSNFTDEETDKVIDLAENYLFTTTLEDFVKDNFSYCPECDMKWQDIKEHCYNKGSGYTKDKDLVKAIKMIIPVGKESKIRKNGGYNFWCLKRGREKSKKVNDIGDGLPF
jgi:hypothetical protein